MHPKITILGCGLAGMISALSFAARNIEVTIIEGRSFDDPDFFKDIRSTALTACSKDFLDDIEVWNKLEGISAPFNDIYVADNRAPEMLHFSSSKTDDSEIMGHLVENTDFKKILFKLVQKNKLIRLYENSSYSISENTEESCRLIINDKIEHECDLLIACDGRNSLARKQYFSSEIEHSYNQHAITFITHHEKKHEGSAVEHFMHSGPFAILPLKDQNLSSIVWTIKSEKKNALMNLPEDEFTYLVQKNFGEFLGKITIKSKIAAFPLKAYGTKNYYNKRIVLLADSAHIIHPLAGQGLNQGIKDIASLVSLISDSGISMSILEKYQQSRKVDNNNMLEATDLINLLFSNSSKLLLSMRQLGFKAIEELPLLKNLLIKYAMGKR